MLPWKFRRGLSLAIPFITALVLWGATKSLFGVGVTDNIAQTGVTMSFVLGALNAWLWYLIYRNQTG